MLTIRETERRKSKYGPVVDVIVVGPRAQLEQLREMYDKPLSRDFWGVDREQWAWEQDGALRLGFHGSDSEVRNAVKDAVKILGTPRPNPARDNPGPLHSIIIVSSRPVPDRDDRTMTNTLMIVTGDRKEINLLELRLGQRGTFVDEMSRDENQLEILFNLAPKDAANLVERLTQGLPPERNLHAWKCPCGAEGEGPRPRTSCPECGEDLPPSTQGPSGRRVRKNPIVAWRCSHCDYEGTGDPPKRCPKCKR